MRELTGQIKSDHVVEEDTEVRGQIAGSCRVLAGATLILNGQIAGDLVVDEGADAVVRGMVGGSVQANGAVQVLGMIAGSASGVGLRVESGSYINGVQQR